MGAAARKIAQPATPARPRLKVVRGGATRTRAQSTASADGVFRVLTVCLMILAVAGVLRVSLAARAAESTIDAWEVRAEVKAERQATRTLEADRSALASPSRIEALACETLNMTKPAQVCYLELPDAENTPDVGGEVSAPIQVATADTSDDTAGGGVIRTLMDLAASEAQVLLVGDMGLGSMR
ncbi:MAG: cell division protein FtsL [Coriobacteriia bacterium]|nr:cell division protein FtsL [Coriobacteriia bacterium]MBN2841130.1 cell division protein FtsL [Coriobacteriia bacterium]